MKNLLFNDKGDLQHIINLKIPRSVLVVELKKLSSKALLLFYF